MYRSFEIDSETVRDNFRDCFARKGKEEIQHINFYYVSQILFDN